jgi:hypothetical protein
VGGQKKDKPCVSSIISEDLNQHFASTVDDGWLTGEAFNTSNKTKNLQCEVMRRKNWGKNKNKNKNEKKQQQLLQLTSSNLNYSIDLVETTTKGSLHMGQTSEDALSGSKLCLFEVNFLSNLSRTEKGAVRCSWNLALTRMC